MYPNRPPRILCVMRMPPDLNGHGGSQRAWHLVQALLPHGKVHFVLIYRGTDYDCVNTSLAPLEPLVESVTRINITGWQGALSKRFGVVPPGLWDLLTMRSHEAPYLSDAELQSVAARLPIRNPDIVFAGRLCSAVVMQGLMDRGLLTTALKVVDFDDIMSKFRLRQVRNAGAMMKYRRRFFARIDAEIIARAESRMARSWHGVSVCTDEDVADLRAAHPGAAVSKIPNVVDRDLLPPRARDGRFRLLFVGNLSFAANTDGLRVFVEQAWPALLQAVPEAKLDVVGINPSAQVVALTERHGLGLHANVPSLKPFYADCDAVIAPILFGSGTRIKILEAMAYGRPVVSTSLGAEGMGLESGRHLLIADTMAAFAAALATLARDPKLGEALVAQARAFQQQHYTPSAIDAAMADLIARGRLGAARARAAYAA